MEASYRIDEVKTKRVPLNEPAFNKPMDLTASESLHEGKVFRTQVILNTWGTNDHIKVTLLLLDEEGSLELVG